MKQAIFHSTSVLFELHLKYVYFCRAQSSEKDVDILRSSGESNQEKEEVVVKSRSISGAVWTAKEMLPGDLITVFKYLKGSYVGCTQLVM